MPISILPPAAPPPSRSVRDTSPTSSDDDADSLSGEAMDLDSTDPSTSTLLTPGTLLTSDTQFMRGHGTFLPSSTSTSASTQISSSLLGTLTRTNKLLSITPLSARYSPEIGDLVIGRVTEVQSKRWKVDIASSRAANLPLSAINLPGGVQRKRTAVDELNMRLFFQEGDVLVAEVQGLGATDGAAGLHARSLRYGKLRNGVFVDVGGRRQGRAAGVKRSKRHIFALQTRHGEVDVIVGVNGYVFVALPGGKGKKEGEGLGVGTGRDDGGRDMGEAMYSCQNDEVGAGLRVEISRVVACIKVLVERGVGVDEDVIRRAYDAAVDLELMDDVAVGQGSYLGGDRGQAVVDMALGVGG